MSIVSGQFWTLRNIAFQWAYTDRRFSNIIISKIYIEWSREIFQVYAMDIHILL